MIGCLRIVTSLCMKHFRDNEVSFIIFTNGRDELQLVHPTIGLEFISAAVCALSALLLLGF